METITNMASTAATTASKLIYGDTTTAQNETAGKEPISGEQGKGTVTEPFDKGNAEDATAAATSLSDAKIEPTHTLEPTGAVREPNDLLNAYEDAAGPNATAPTTTAVTDKLWKPTEIDAVKPSVADPAAAPETGVGNTEGKKGDLWRPTEVYQESAPGVTDGTVSPMDTTSAPSSNIAAVTSNNNLDTYKLDSNKDKVSSDKETAAITKLDSHEPATGKSTGLAEEKSAHKDKVDTKADTKTETKAESSKDKSELSKKTSPSSAADDEDDKSKMSALKDKLKTKLHIGHKDK